MRLLLASLILASLLLVSAAEAATDVTIEVYLKSPVVTGVEYGNLFRIDIENKTNCSIKDSVFVNYNITNSGSLVKEGKFNKSIGCYGYADTGTWKPSTAGNYTLCGLVTNTTAENTNSSNDFICGAVEVIDSNSISCDLSLDVNASDWLYDDHDTIEYNLIVNDLSCSNFTHPYLINYKIVDFFGDYLRSPYNSTYDIKCTDASTHQKQADEICGTEAYWIEAKILNTNCNDTNTANNEDKFLIIVRGKNPESSSCKTSSSIIGGGSTTTATTDTTANFEINILEFPQVVATGQTFILKVEIKNKFSTTKTFEVYSYIFDKQKLLTEGGWSGNKQVLPINAGQSFVTFLPNTVREDAELGIYSFRARVTVGDAKLDDTKDIEIVKGNFTNETKIAEITSFYTKTKELYAGRQVNLYSRVENKLNSEQNFTLELVNVSTQAEQNSAGPRSVTASEKEITLGPKAAKTFDFQITLPDYSIKYILKLMQNQTIIDEESLDLNITSAEMPANPKFNYPEITGDLIFSSRNRNTDTAVALFVAVLLTLVLALLKTKSK
jgi:hypothetical protein